MIFHLVHMLKLKVGIYKIPIDTNKNLDLKKSLIKAHELGFSRIFIETGASTKLHGEYVEERSYTRDRFAYTQSIY